MNLTIGDHHEGYICCLCVCRDELTLGERDRIFTSEILPSVRTQLVTLDHFPRAQSDYSEKYTRQCLKLTIPADHLRTKRRGQAGTSWYVDETYIRIHGKWCYLYRAIDWDGNLVDSRLSEKRDIAAAKRFFQQARDVVGHAPEQVTTDGHDVYPRAIRETLDRDVLHRTNRSLNNRVEQDYRGIKQRDSPMRGFGSFESASRFCRAFDVQRDYFRFRTTMGETVPLAQQRHLFQERFALLQSLLLAS